MQGSMGSAAHLFAGQGSQIKGMGRELFPLFPDLLSQADDILGYRLDRLCLDDPGGGLQDTRHTQPALFVVNALAPAKHLRDGGSPPAMAAGHSLGEYNALLAADAFDFATGLSIVKKRAELMAAVIGLSREAVARVLADGFPGLDMANVNTPTQVVISGPVDEVVRAEAGFVAAGCLAFVRLPVGGAFHSRLMGRAAAEFAAFLSGTAFRPPRIPVISNVTGEPYDADVGGLLARQITSSVNWLSCIWRMLDMGASEFVEFAPKPVLAPMLREIKSQWTPSPAPRPAAPAAPVPGGGVAARSCAGNPGQRRLPRRPWNEIRLCLRRDGARGVLGGQGGALRPGGHPLLFRQRRPFPRPGRGGDPGDSIPRRAGRALWRQPVERLA